jgi:chitinase
MDRGAEQMSTAPWFTGYVDVTLPSSYEFDRPPNSSAAHAMLSFVVADPTQPCVPSWGGHYSLDEAATELDLDQRVRGLREDGGSVAIAFGGQQENELATVCSDQTALVNAYRSVIQHYNVHNIDLDIEGRALTDRESQSRRAKAIRQLQSERDPDDPLRVWLTLPVTPLGLQDSGTAAVRAFLLAGVDLAGVNIMTMNYGASRAGNQTMLEASIDAAEATHHQLGVLYDEAGLQLDDREIWHTIGLTPMIGQNDVDSDMFDLAAAEGLNEFARRSGVGRLSFWSLNRDRQCTEYESDQSQPSNTCSSVPQESGDFSKILGNGYSNSGP